MNKTRSVSKFNLLKVVMVAIFVIAVSDAFSQKNAEIQNVDFKLQDNQLIITYDISKAKKTDIFNVDLLIRTKSGKTITPKSISGDAGNNISGGTGKVIYWDVLKDNTYLDEEITVEITAKPENQVVLPEARNLKTGVCVLKSIVFPGWGNYSINRKNANWLFGVTAYGCAAGAFALNRINISKYDNDYLNEYDITKRDKVYNTIKTQHYVSIGLLAAAGTLWITDIILTWAQASKYKKQNISGNNHERNYSFGMYYDPTIKASTVSFRYSF